MTRRIILNDLKASSKYYSLCNDPKEKLKSQELRIIDFYWHPTSYEQVICGSALSSLATYQGMNFTCGRRPNADCCKMKEKQGQPGC